MHEQHVSYRRAVRLRPSYRRNLSTCVFYIILVPANVHAYVDPGTTGMVSQLLYLLFYGALAVLLYSIRYLKNLSDQIGEYIRKILNVHK